MKCVIDGDTVIAHDDEINMLQRITRKAVEYIESRAQADREQPFFLVRSVWLSTHADRPYD